eukprot:tig00001001_g6191.t1
MEGGPGPGRARPPPAPPPVRPRPAPRLALLALLAALALATLFGPADAADGDVTLMRAGFVGPWSENKGFLHDSFRDDVHFTIAASAPSFIAASTKLAFLCANGAANCGNAAEGEAVLTLNASKLVSSQGTTKCVFSTNQFNCTLANALVSCLPTFTFEPVNYWQDSIGVVASLELQADGRLAEGTSFKLCPLYKLFVTVEGDYVVKRDGPIGVHSEPVPDRAFVREGRFLVIPFRLNISGFPADRKAPGMNYGAQLCAKYINNHYKQYEAGYKAR